jgi:hypothetical protein
MGITLPVIAIHIFGVTILVHASQELFHFFGLHARQSHQSSLTRELIMVDAQAGGDTGSEMYNEWNYG